MDLIDRLQALGHRAAKQIEHLKTEEAAKTALVLPFISALGYDVFDPTEVIPEFTADVGTKKGEKVDYAIMGEEEHPIMLFECKSVQCNLNEAHASQLYRYFSVTQARVGVLTNGLVYRFFSDLEEPNKMDPKPFLELDLLNLTEAAVAEVKRLSKSSFDVDNVVSAAVELKYTKGIKRVLIEEFQTPSDDLIRLLAKQVYSKNLTQAVRDQFRPIVKRALAQFISERINERLQHALNDEAGASDESDPEEKEPILPEGVVSIVGDIVTTEDEVEGYRIVKSIMREVVDVSRVAMRDTKSYCGILFDDNNRKPICRLRFNSSQYYLGLFDAEKNEDKVPIDSLDDIYKYADRLKATAGFYGD